MTIHSRANVSILWTALGSFVAATSPSMTSLRNIEGATNTFSVVWSEIELLKRAMETTRQQQMHLRHNNNRNLQLQRICALAMELFDEVAPQNDNRECSCNWLATSMHCKYNDVTCQDKVLPSVDIKLDVGAFRTKVEICQEFMEEEFEPICIEADLVEFKYDTCNKVTVGQKECSCEVCEGGMMIDVDCTESHPMAKTNGCQRVFFQDSCLDFAPPILTEAESNTTIPEETTTKDSESNATILQEILPTTATSRVSGNPFLGRSSQQTPAPTLEDTVTPEGPPQHSNETSSGSNDTLVEESFGLIFPDDPYFDSPEQRADEWIQGDPYLTTYSTNKKMQRYSLAALYYSTTSYDVNWFQSGNWMSYEVDECDWYTNSSEHPCSESSGELEILDLSKNGLFGSLPSEIGNLQSLKSLYLPFNFLSGTLPTQIGSLMNLETLDLQSSDIGGHLPTELGLLSNLESLSLQLNWFDGTIPSELGMLTNAVLIKLFGNFLSGQVPSEVCDLISMHDTQVHVECNITSCTCGCICL